MGSCVSVHKDPESAVVLRLSVGSKDEKLLMTSTVEQELDTVNGVDRAVADLSAKSDFSSRFRGAGSKDDAFFDSQPWLDSDCDDDFLSVNGDFTPSRGSTPVHHKFSSGNPTVNNSSVLEETLGSVPEQPSNPDKKKRLYELFKESLRLQNYTDEENEANDENVKPEATTLGQSKSTNGIEAKSTPSSEKKPGAVIRAEDESVKSTQCCLPSFSARKKKTSPVLMVCLPSFSARKKKTSPVLMNG